MLQCHWRRFWLQEQVIKTELKLDLADFNQDLTEATSYLSPKPCDINSMPRIDLSEEIPICSDFPELPINDVGEFQSPRTSNC